MLACSGALRTWELESIAVRVQLASVELGGAELAAVGGAETSLVVVQHSPLALLDSRSVHLQASHLELS